MSLLDRSGTYVGPDGMMIDGVTVLDGAGKVHLVAEARAAALAAAVRLIASGGKWTHRAPLELAGSFEEWLLRDEEAPR